MTHCGGLAPWTALMLTAFVAACGGGNSEGSAGDTSGGVAPAPKYLTAATLGDQTVRSAAEYLGTVPYLDADRENGATHAQVCRACHTMDAGGPNMLGPNLHGFFGRAIGSVSGFDYSDAVKDVEFVWTPRALEAWLSQPGRFLPGNRMAFGGVADAGDRADLIAYLLDVTNGAEEH